MRRSLLALIATWALAGCSEWRPLDERADAAVDGGADAGDDDAGFATADAGQTDGS